MQKLETILVLFFGTVVFLVIGGVLIALFLWAHYATTILILAGVVFVVSLLAVLSKAKFFEFVQKVIEICIEDKRERRKTMLELKAQQRIQYNELALHYVKLRDETRLRTMELEIAKMTAMVESQVKYLEVERWHAEQAAGILAYQSSQALYKPETGEVINLSREPREPLLQAPPPSFCGRSSTSTAIP